MDIVDEEVAREEGGEIFVLSMQLLEDKQHVEGEECNVPILASS